VITTDLVAREPDFFNPEFSLDGPISLKQLTRQCVHELERKVILKVLQQHHWNRKQAARTLGISYRALLYKIRDAGLPSNRALRLQQAEKNKPAADGPTDDARPTSGAAAD
jgi:transcriptional regulator with GAF, ATPase, and Fis domain